MTQFEVNVAPRTKEKGAIPARLETCMVVEQKVRCEDRSFCTKDLSFDYTVLVIFEYLTDLLVKVIPLYCIAHPCRRNSMQFLSPRSCNFKIARVNRSAISARLSAISPRYRRVTARFEMQPMKL